MPGEAETQPPAATPTGPAVLAVETSLFTDNYACCRKQNDMCSVLFFLRKPVQPT